MPVLNAIRAFEAAGHHDSFTGAARELNVTHAAISRHVRGLERQLGIQLFRRVARGVTLTEIGKNYLAGITPALDQISNISEDLRTSTSGKITISCEPTFAMKWLMPRLGNFQDCHPEIDILLVSSPDIADIKNNEFDMAIRYCTQNYDGVAFDLISKTPVYPYGIPEFAIAKSPEELLRYRLLHEDTGQLWSRWFAEAGMPDFTPPHHATSLTSLLAIEGALAGQGIVLTPPEIVANDVNIGRLKRLSNVGLDFGGYYIFYQQDIIRRKPAAVFRDWIISETTVLRQV